MIIEVCGTGCPKCKATKTNARKALDELGLKEDEEVAVTEVKDIKSMAARGVLFTPAVVIDGVKVAEGKIPNAEEIKKWVTERLPQNDREANENFCEYLGTEYMDKQVAKVRRI